MSTTHTGGCLCGAIRYECTHDLSAVVACHCTDCQKASGAGASHNAVVPTDAIKIVSGEPRVFEKTVDSGRKLKRYFCAECGSPLFTQRENAPQMMVLKIGSLDDPSGLQMAMNIWTRSARPWMHIDEKLSNHEQNRPA